MSKQKQKSLVIKKISRNIYNLTEKQKLKAGKEGLFKQMVLPFPEDYRKRKNV